MSISDFKNLSIKNKLKKISFSLKNLEYNLLKNKNAMKGDFIVLSIEHIVEENKKIQYYTEIFKEKHPGSITILSQWYKGYNDFLRHYLSLKIPGTNSGQLRSFFKSNHLMLYGLHDLYSLPYTENDFSNLNEQYVAETDRKITVDVCLDNIRSPFNVGSIIRTAESFGFRKIYLYGIAEKIDRQKICKTSKNAENFIEIESFNNTLLTESPKKWDSVICMEKTGQSIPITDLKPEKGFSYLLVVGNEEFGIGDFFLSKSDQHIHIPMQGVKNSLNVANALSIAAFYFNSHIRSMF